MFFGLRYVINHPVYDLQSALESFLSFAAKGNAFDVQSFPVWFRSVIGASPQLRHRFEIVAQIIANQTPEQRQKALDVFINNNRVKTLCEKKDFQLELASNLAPNLQDSIKDLFNYLFDTTLTTKAFLAAVQNKSISEHYLRFREANDMVCPFCSIESYPDKESGTRASYDHYLSRSIYPFAGCNFENLIPMCKSCNEAPNKRDKNILFTATVHPQRREAFFPYAEQAGIKVKILRTGSRSPRLPSGWKVVLQVKRRADQEKLRTSDDIFRLTSRLQARLQEKNAVWTKLLVATVFGDTEVCTVTSFRLKLRRQAQTLAQPIYLRSRAESALESAFYQYLAKHARKPEIEAYCKMSSSDYINVIAQRSVGQRTARRAKQ